MLKVTCLRNASLMDYSDISSTRLKNSYINIIEMYEIQFCGINWENIKNTDTKLI